jgi:hypothetical protein
MEKIRIRDKHPGSATPDMRQYKDDVPGCGRAALVAFPSGWAASAPGCLSPQRALRVVTHTHTSHSHSAQFAGNSVFIFKKISFGNANDVESRTQRPCKIR